MGRKDTGGLRQVLRFELLDKGVDAAAVGEGLGVDSEIRRAERREIKDGLEGREVGRGEDGGLVAHYRVHVDLE